MIERTSIPTFSALTQKEIADWIKIDLNSDPDTVSILLESATEYVEGLCNLAIVQANYRVTEINVVGYELPFSISPVQSITAVNLTKAGQTSAVAGYSLAAGRLMLPVLTQGELLTVDLVAGYASLDDIPVGIRQAIAVLVSAGYNNREALDPATMTTVANLVARYRRYC